MIAKIVPMEKREYGLISLNQVRVLNTRKRDEKQFVENVRSIDKIGLLKPIIVNRRHHGTSGLYDLVCGEGRYLAYKRLGKTQITAEIIDVDDRTALMLSLVENIARNPPGSLAFAYAIKNMYEDGLTFSRIGEIVNKDHNWVSDFIHLVDQGEERLIKGVEQGLFPPGFAAKVARASDVESQHVLMDAFESGLINTVNVGRIRALVGLRQNRGKDTKKTRKYTLADLKGDITRLTKEKEGFVREASDKESRMLTLSSDMSILWKDEAFLQLMAVEGIGDRPDLQFDYAKRA